LSGQSAGGTTLDPMMVPQVAANCVDVHSFLHVNETPGKVGSSHFA
jgi:hypothetical protein